MNCSICNENRVSIKRCRGGMLCESCLKKLPEAVRINIKDFDIKPLSELIKVIKPIGEEQAITMGHFGISKSGVQLNNIHYDIRNIKEISTNLHPIESTEYGFVKGTMTIIIELKNPRFLIEEPCFDNKITAAYSISGRNITYRFSEKTEYLISLINSAVEKGASDLGSFIDLYFERFASKKEENKKEENKNNYYETPDEKLAWALRTLELTLPVTEEDIHRKKRALNLKYHPDLGGSEEKAKEINYASSILSAYLKGERY